MWQWLKPSDFYEVLVRQSREGGEGKTINNSFLRFTAIQDKTEHEWRCCTIQKSRLPHSKYSNDILYQHFLEVAICWFMVPYDLFREDDHMPRNGWKMSFHQASPVVPQSMWEQRQETAAKEWKTNWDATCCQSLVGLVASLYQTLRARSCVWCQTHHTPPHMLWHVLWQVALAVRTTDM